MTLEQAAEAKWGAHPSWWPTPPRQMPRWWQRKAKRVVSELQSVFGPLDQSSLDAFWREIHKGQSVYEDAGGYIWRCYQAMAGMPVDDPYTYYQAAEDWLAGRKR